MSKEQAAAISKEAAEERKFKNLYRSAFLGSEEGKKVLLDILQSCGVVRPVWVKSDPEQSAYNEGMRTVALGILDKLDVRGYQDIMNLEKEGIDLLKMGEFE